MDIAAMMKLKRAKDTFFRNHPKLPSFFQAVGKAKIGEGTVIELTVRVPDGEPLSANIRLKESDMELLSSLRKMAQEKETRR